MVICAPSVPGTSGNHGLQVHLGRAAKNRRMFFSKLRKCYRSTLRNFNAWEIEQPNVAAIPRCTKRNVQCLIEKFRSKKTLQMAHEGFNGRPKTSRTEESILEVLQEIGLSEVHRKFISQYIVLRNVTSVCSHTSVSHRNQARAS